jgi:hypothetical protein
MLIRSRNVEYTTEPHITYTPCYIQLFFQLYEKAEFMGFVSESDLENFISKNNLKEYSHLKDVIKECGIKVV